MPTKRLQKTPSFQDLKKAWKIAGNRPLHWGGLWGASKACLTAGLKPPLLLIIADSHAVELALDDLTAFGAGGVPFPARESSSGTEPEVLRERHHALNLAQRKGFGGILVAPISALLQPVPSAKDKTLELHLKENMRVDPEAFMKQLLGAGFERVPSIHEPGEFSRRGDILDFFSPTMGEPLRLEFFGDELESVRVFDLKTQRTRHVLKSVVVPLTQGLPLVGAAHDTLLLERLPKNFSVVAWEPSAIDESIQRLRGQGAEWVAALNRHQNLVQQRPQLQLATLPGQDGSLTTLSVEEYCQGVATGGSLLAQRAEDGENAYVLCSTSAEADRLEQILQDSGVAHPKLHRKTAGLSRGFRIPEARLTVLHHRELVPGHGVHRPKPRHSQQLDTETVKSAHALRPGDWVVHAVHGVGCFRGLDSDGKEGQDFLLLEFRDKAILRVPASRVDLVERYVGAGGGSPNLDRLGSGSFLKRRQKVADAVEDMAADMLEIQATRTSLPGFAFPEPGEDQRNFEASFPWEDTPDQAQGTREIHDDLSLPRAMDRLLCGDVGYGKTELAARAAFRAIHAGKQVAILVPTTVLAEQHFQSFCQRFADWPIEIAALSRLVRPADRRQALAGLACGKIDLVIGTHRLLSKDVHFSNLGLVVIDEEQRFGVKHKELLKKKRAQVDVLTLSATPVPRTLHMALAGIRDITTLSTAPKGRQEVHTEIRFDNESDLIQDALQREVGRGGQVFFVHNRIRTLESAAEKLRRKVPGLRVEIGHGQMEPKQLERVMLQFVRGEIDVLCSTTIVESGLDIPNANTIFIDGAHRYGLADLHQLRGRVGRSSKRAWCYLLVPKGQPLPMDARRRLKAVEELRYLGAGFQIAMRDLEIRGAGNLLGAEQSGHIAAVGYETYRKLLAQAVARLRNEQKSQEKSGETIADISLGVQAAVSPLYITEEEARMEVLRDFDALRTPQEVNAILASLKDRFGPAPEETQRLAQLFFLKHRLGALGLSRVQRIEGHLLCKLTDAKKLTRALAPHQIDLRILTPRQAHWILPNPKEDAKSVLQYLFKVASSCRLPRAKRKSTSTSAP